MTRPLVCALALLLASAVASAQEKPAPPGAAATPGGPGQPQGPVVPSAAEPDVRDLLFTGDVRPLLIRLHLRVDDRPLAEAMKAFHQKLFRHYDLDGDGVLSPREAARVLNAQFLQQTLTGQGNYFDMRVQRAQMEELDANKDGKVTPEELEAYYTRGGLKAFEVQAGGSSNVAGRQTQTLMKFLDRDGDGKLSTSEVADGLRSLRKLDAEEDDAITRDEVQLVQGIQYAEDAYGPRGRRTPPVSPLDALTPGEPLKPLIAKLLVRYDKDKDQKLGRSEIGLTEEVFNKLDADHDGGLDEKELAGFFALPPDLELMVRWPSGRPTGGLVATALSGLASKAAGRETQQPFAPPGRTPPLNGGVVKERDAHLLTLADGQVRMQAQTTQALSLLEGVKKYHARYFKELDADGDGALSRKEAELAQGAEDYQLRGLWAIADRDGDGRLTPEELNEWLELEAEGAASTGVLRMEDQGRGLFEVLDGDGDGKLSEREFRTAWQRLQRWDRDGDGLVSVDELPKQFTLTLDQGRLEEPYYRTMGVARGMAATVKSTGKGPAWFRKMDRNGDGDLNRREWLGTEEDFRRYDLDGDGLISAEEAERYEKEHPAAKPPLP